MKCQTFDCKNDIYWGNYYCIHCLEKRAMCNWYEEAEKHREEFIKFHNQQEK
jgi:hypothetical protein